eukprot:scaffold37718_cov187-Skeletonema_marinoi.AAC.9
MSVHLGRSGDNKYPWGSAKYPFKYPCGWHTNASEFLILLAIVPVALWWSLRDQHKQTRKSRRRRKVLIISTVLVSIDLISVEEGSSDDNSFLFLMEY